MAPQKADASSRESGYRLDIQGLRAIAVLSVVIHHFERSILPGGYLGVDIFYVISGFVITSSIFNRQPGSIGSFVLGFISRRLRRLFPALLFCVGISAIAFSVLDPHPSRVLWTGLSSLVGLSNFQLWKSGADYFSPAADENPFTHTWSLGVEEQFYLVFPFAFWLFLSGRVGRRATILCLAVCALVSLAGFLFLFSAKPAATFYLSPFRFWEIAAGCLLFMVLGERRYEMRGASAIAFAAVLVLMALFIYPPDYQGIDNLITVLAAVLTIAFSRDGVQSALSTSPFVFFGNISYSLYLWHWPVVVMGRIVVGISLFTVPILFVLMLALSVFSFYCIERPIRHASIFARPMHALLASAGGLVPVAALIGLLAMPLNGALYTGTKAVLIVEGIESLAYEYRVANVPAAIWRPEPCILTSNNQVGKRIRAEHCLIARKGASGPRALVLGNSFTAALAPAFDELIREHGWRVILTSSWDASPAPGIPNNTYWNLANDYYWETVATKLISGLEPGDWVVLMNDLHRFSPTPHGEPPAMLATLRRSLQAFSARLEAKGIKLAVLNALPFAREAKCTPQQALPQWFKPFGPSCVLYPRSETLKRRGPLDRVLRELEGKGALTTIDLMDLFCPGPVCGYRLPDGTFLYRDQYSHPSVRAARLAAPMVTQALLGNSAKTERAGGDRSTNVR